MSAPLEVDYYAVLEVDEKAGSDDIKRAFRRLSLLKHPDKNSGNPTAHAAFCALNEAYDTLKDTSRRILYDVKYQNIKQKWDDFRRSQEDERTRKNREKDEKAKVERLYKEYMDVQAVSVKKVGELHQERQRMVQIREDIAKKEADIENIKEAGRERSRLEKQGEGWLKYLTTGWGRTAADIERDKVKREQENLQKLASERIKIELLEGLKRRLQQSEKNQLDQVLEFETQDKVWKEKVMRVRKAWETEINRRAAEQWRAQEEERKKSERNRLAREAKEAAERKKAAEEGERQEQERQRKKADELRNYFDSLAKARAERVAATGREAAAKMSKEKKREAEEKLKKEQRRAEFYAKGTRSHTSHRNTRPGSSIHPRYWPKVQGGNRCSVCAQWFNLFILQCPQCDIMACAGCKRMVPGPCEREEISHEDFSYFD